VRAVLALLESFFFQEDLKGAYAAPLLPLRVALAPHPRKGGDNAQVALF
jgi:hypothetical protein